MRFGVPVSVHFLTQNVDKTGMGFVHLNCKKLFACATLAVAAFLASGANARAADPKSWLETLKETISTHSIQSIEELLPQIPAEFRKNFSLVFESRSTMGASFEKPRVILRNEDSSVIMAFAGDSSLQNGNALEIIEQNAKTKQFEFSAISFKTNPPVYSDGTSCIGCHAMKGVPNTIRPIWDTYPDWPGMYGQSHNGATFQEEGGVGTSGIKRLDFEKKAYQKFLESAPNSKLYSKLAGFGEGETAPTLRELSELNNAFGKALNNRNAEAIATQLSSHLRFAKEHGKLLKQLDGWVSVDKKQIEEGSERIRNYYIEKADRMKQLVKDFGSDEDKAFVEKGLPLSVRLADREKMLAYELRFANKYVLVEDMVKNLGVSPESLSLAFGSKGLVLEDGASRWSTAEDTSNPVMTRYLRKHVYNIVVKGTNKDLLDRSYGQVKTADDFVDMFYYDSRKQLSGSKEGFEEAYRKYGYGKLPEFLKLSPTEEQWQKLSESRLFRGDSEAHLRGVAEGKIKGGASCFLSRLQRVIP